MKKELILSLLICSNLSYSMNGMTPENKLFIGAKSNDIQFIKEALELGANVNSVNRIGYSPLMDSIESASVDAVNFLLQSGANPNFRNAMGKTALMYSSSMAFLNENDRSFVNKIKNIIIVLIKSGADVDIVDASNRTVFDIARGQGMNDLIQFIKDQQKIAIKQRVEDFLPADLSSIISDYVIDYN